MSRIGKKIVPVPQGVEVQIAGNTISVKGKKGTLKREIHKDVEVQKTDAGLAVVTKPQAEKSANKFQGLTRTLVNNMVVGVSTGFTKGLTLVGVGYRAALKGRELQLTLGFSHPVAYQIPEGVDIAVDKQVNLTVSGANKELVGQVAADIRAYRRPEPYHGKGVRYSDEVIVTKVGKSSAKK